MFVRKEAEAPLVLEDRPCLASRAQQSAYRIASEQREVRLIMGIPHVLLDHNYANIRAFYSTWPSGGELVEWADFATWGLAQPGSWA